MFPRFFSRSCRRQWHRFFPPNVALFYDPKYNSAFPNVPNDPLRAERILAFLASEGLIAPRNVRPPEPASLKELGRVHGQAYLDSLLEEATIGQIMGGEILGGQVDRLLDLQRLQTGGTVAAARLARSSHPLVVNLGGGFHHAHAEQGGGFCVFNDVAVAIADLRRRGFTSPILVVDLDLHDGDGTRAIFAHDASVHTFSIHARHWGPTEAIESTSVELGSEIGDEAYLASVRAHLPAVIQRFRPQLVFYLAGCDPAREDRLGSWRITESGMLERDRFVMAQVRSLRGRVPVVVLLAGGYSPVTWRYTARFLSDQLARGGPIEPPSTEEITLRRYRYISRLLPTDELSGAGGHDEFGLTEADLFLPAWGVRRESRLLGFYTKHGVELVLERTGIFDRLRDLGFDQPTLDVDLDDPAGETVRVFGAPDRKEVLVEMRLRRDRRSIPEMELLTIEWLLLQNPRASFSPTRPALPGQKHPGLGMLKDTVALLIVACERLRLDGLVFVPSQFHVASQLHGRLFFLNPQALARYNALHRAFAGRSLAEGSRAIAEGRVVDTATGEVFRWQPETMVLPISEKLMGELGRRAKAAGSSGEPPRYSFRVLERAESAETLPVRERSSPVRTC